MRSIKLWIAELVREEIRLFLKDHYRRRSIKDINEKALVLTCKEVNLPEEYLRKYFRRAHSEPNRPTRSLRHIPRF